MQKLCFIYNPKIPENRALGEDLAQRYGGVSEQDADILVPVGGDGSVLYALHLAAGRTVFGVVPGQSTSRAYTSNRYMPGDDLIADIASSIKYPLHPIVTDIAYDDGSHQTVRAHSILSIGRHSGQAAMLDITATFNAVSRRVKTIGDGLAFGTPVGSTGMTWSHHGPVIPPDRPAMIAVGLGLGEPAGFRPIIAGLGNSFTVGCITSHGKRSLRIDMDGDTVHPPQPGLSPATVTLALAQSPDALLAVRPGTFHPFRRLGLD